jgi:hypothetical protein
VTHMHLLHKLGRANPVSTQIHKLSFFLPMLDLHVHVCPSRHQPGYPPYFLLFFQPASLASFLFRKFRFIFILVVGNLLSPHDLCKHANFKPNQSCINIPCATRTVQLSCSAQELARIMCTRNGRILDMEWDLLRLLQRCSPDALLLCAAELVKWDVCVLGVWGWQEPDVNCFFLS